MTGEEATQFCQVNGGILVEVKSQTEQNILARQIKADSRDLDEFWIGITYSSLERAWVWQSSGGKLEGGYTNWGEGNTNDISQPCARMRRLNNLWSWYDRGCHTKYFPICEKSKSSIN